MPTRATKRGIERTPLDADADVLVCGASFAGLAVARELAGAGARVLMVDRYEVGERQTSACAAPTEWLENLDLAPAIRQTFPDLVVHAPGRTSRWPLPWSFSTFDYPELCARLREQGADAEFETAKVEGRTGRTVHTDRGDLRAPLIVDALGWRRVLGPGVNVQPPEARLSRGLEVHPRGSGEDLEIWLDAGYVRAGYSWNFPAGDETRVGVGSFDPRDHVKEPTVRLAADLGLPPDGFQGNWIPHQIRPAVEDGVLFVGDSAGHCIATTAEGIRTALYFGLAAGRELRGAVAGRQSAAAAVARYGAFSDAHAWKFDSMLRVQTMVSGMLPRPATIRPLMRALEHEPVTRWAFGHYLRIAHPSFALAAPRPIPGRRRAATAAGGTVSSSAG